MTKPRKTKSTKTAKAPAPEQWPTYRPTDKLAPGKDPGAPTVATQWPTYAPSK